MKGRVRVGDGSGEATVVSNHGEECLVLYKSGARRRVHRRNLAELGEPTPAERRVLTGVRNAGETGREFQGPELRVAVAALVDAGYLVEERRVLVLTTKGTEAASKLTSERGG